MTDPADLLEQLVRMPTPNPGGDEAALARLLEARLQQLGADEVSLAEVPRPGRGAPGAWVLARWGTPRLLVNAHLDTVPPGPGWSTPPFEPHRSAGRVTGLGAADTKGAIAAIVCALEQARPRDTAVLFSGDEEHGNACMRSFLRSDFARGLRHAVVCEPTGLRIGVRHRGIISMEISAAGPGGHSSRADETPAPVADLARIAAAWDAWARGRRAEGPPGFQGLCLNIARLDGGVAFNVIPTEATLHVSLRPPPGADTATLKRDLLALAAEQAPGAQVRLVLDNPPFASRNAQALARLLGGRPTADLGYWTEAALLSQAGIDAVVFGPGDIARAHAADEHVEEAQLAEARDAFVALFRTVTD